MMRGGKGGESFRFRKPREVKNPSNEVPPTTRVLRSHKRKLPQTEPNNEVKLVQKKRKSSALLDASDCIVLSDSDSINPAADVNQLITSTPISRNRLKTPDFDQSCIKSAHNKQPLDNTDDVIVISDSSAPTLPIIVLSDREDSDVEVIPCEKKKQKRISQKSLDKETETKKEQVLQDVVNKKKCESPPRPNVAVVKPRRIPPSKAKFNSRKPRIDKRRKANDQPVRQRYRAGHGCQIGENIYVENPVILPKKGLRPIIIDGSNVAFHHSNNSYFSCKGLEICIKYFKNRGHEVIAFVPQYRVQYKESDNPRLLDLLVKSGDVVLTPSRMVNGSRIVPYDDRFIVQTAVIKGGIIVTRDNYRDLLIENPSWAETIKYRLLQFTWVQDLLMFPNDPLGKRGPSLDEFLRFG